MHSVMQWSGRVDVLVNNAGVADFGPIQETTFARWQTVMRTNLDGVFLCSQAVLPALRESRGCIVNIASISGLRASTLRVAYGTSKAAVIHLTKQQAAELGEWGIRVNCVAPGSTLSEEDPDDGVLKMRAAATATRALKRVQTPADLTGAIVFFASADSDFITGQTLVVDGGSCLH